MNESGTKILIRHFLIPVVVLAAIFVSGDSELFAKKAVAEKEAPLEEAVGKSLGKFIAVETGVVRNGEQIPLPFYQDGIRALRKECRYFVSPNEISTAMLFSRTSPSQGLVQQEEVREKVVTATGEVIKREPKTVDVFKLTAPAIASFQGASFYIKCDVNEVGYVNISLWKHGWADQDFNVSQDKTYEDLQEYYKKTGISRAAGIGDDPQAVIMKKIRETAQANYMVVALRSQPSSSR